MGLFSCLFVLGYWELEWCKKQYLFIDPQSIWRHFLKDFWKYGKVPRITLLRHSTCISLPWQYMPLLFPTTTKPLWSSRWDKNRAYLHSIYCKFKEMIHGETSHAISIKRCKCMSGWMDGCGLLLKVMAFSLESSLVSFFLRHGYPFLSLFFGSCFFCMPSFFFLGQP